MRLITLDVESYYDKEYSLSKLTTEQYVRDPRFEIILIGVRVNNQAGTWFSGTKDQVGAWLQQFDIPNSYLLCHHTAFDASILSHHFGIKAKFYLDTLCMATPKHAMTIGVSLKALSDHYTIGVKGDEVFNALGKRRADFTPEELAKYGQYCLNDVALTYMLMGILKQGFPHQELRVIDCLLRMYIDPILELDRGRLDDYLEHVKLTREQTLERVQQLVGEDALMSNPKFAEVLRSMGVEPPTKLSPTTGKSTFAFAKNDPQFKALLEHENPDVQAVVGARLGVKSTIEQTRTEAFIGISGRGTLPVPIKYYAAHTGRAGGWDGINLQNLKRGGELRSTICAPEGHVIVAGDSSQIEARITAWLARQDDLVAAFALARDVYSEFATEVYERQVTRANKEERHVGKTCILGLGYGMGAPKLQTTLKAGTGGPVVNLGLQECKTAVSLYRTKYRFIPRLWNAGDGALSAILKGETYRFGRNGLLYTSNEGIHLPNGMLIRYPGLVQQGGQFAYAGNRRQQAIWTKQMLSGEWDFDLLTGIYGGKVIENVVQALARIVVFDQMLVIAQQYRTVLTVHDEVAVCVPEDAVPDVVPFMTSTMSTPPTWAPDLPVACEVQAGKTYGDAK
jgi:DNA polymerase I-like protein with 3'-5' exonuclease and polymerase domains